MNLTTQIIFKDWRSLRLPLAIWIGSCFALLVVRVVELVTDTYELQFRAGEALIFLVNFGVVSFFLLPFIIASWIFQEDPIAESRAFWRTRPISAWRLLAAKSATVLMLIGGFEVLSWPGLRISPLTALVPVGLIYVTTLSALTRDLKVFSLMLLGYVLVPGYLLLNLLPVARVQAPLLPGIPLPIPFFQGILVAAIFAVIALICVVVERRRLFAGVTLAGGTAAGLAVIILA